MSPTQKNIALAQIRGWERREDGKRWKSPHASAYYVWRMPWPDNKGEYLYTNTLPDFLHDLNALYQIESLLDVDSGQRRRYLNYLSPESGDDWALAHVKVIRKADALLKAFGKWEDGAA